MIRDNMATINIAIEHIHPHPDNPRKDLGETESSIADIYLILAKRGNKDSEDNEDER